MEHDRGSVLVYLWSALTLNALIFAIVPFGITKSMISHGKLLSPGQISGTWHVPKAWFSHFYPVGICLLLIFRLSNFAIGPVLLLSHLLRRSVEQIYLFPYGKDSRMHAAAYLLGYVFYLGATLSVADDPDFPLLTLVGNVIQFYAHRDLFRNRAKGKEKPPVTLLFKYMNCPHYLAEMLIYMGLVSVQSLPSVACAVFVIVSLSVNWMNHSKWYRKNSS
jgi:hypothetical protein